MDGIREVLHIPEANQIIAYSIGLAIWIPTAWFILLRLFPLQRMGRRLWIRVVLLIPALIISHLLFNLAVVTTWTWLDEWAFRKDYGNTFNPSAPNCHLLPGGIVLTPLFLLPVIGCIFGLFRARRLAA